MLDRAIQQTLGNVFMKNKFFFEVRKIAAHSWINPPHKPNRCAPSEPTMRASLGTPAGGPAKPHEGGVVTMIGHLIRASSSLGFAACVVAGCGGSGGNAGAGGGLTQAKPVSSPLFAGAYDGDGLNLRNAADDSCPMVATTDSPQNIVWGKDFLLVSGRHVAYRVCGYRLWTGPINGTVTFSPSGMAAPGSGTAQAVIDYFPGLGATRTQGRSFSGNIVTVGAMDASVASLDLKDSASNTLKFLRIPSASQVVTTSYSTLAGSYRQVDWSVFGSTRLNLDDTLAITPAGTINATTSMGALSGHITTFDPKSGVHDVEMTITPRTGSAFLMAGVIGPGPTTSGGGKDFSNVTLALIGNNQSYAAVFKLR